MRVKGLHVRHVQRSTLGKTNRKIRVGDEELAIGDSVGLALVEELLAGLLVERLVRDIDSAKLLLERGAKRIWTDSFAGRSVAR